MQIIGLERVVEKGTGWMHSLAFELDNGGRVLIIDDTDSIEVYANRPDAITAVDAARVWAGHAMGCSHFPAVPVPADLPRPVVSDYDHVVWTGSGVDFSHLI